MKHDSQRERLGEGFGEEIIIFLEMLAENPLLYSRGHPHKDIRWRHPERFLSRVIFEVQEAAYLAVIAKVTFAHFNLIVVIG
jgi:hypothetical protein